MCDEKKKFLCHIPEHPELEVLVKQMKDNLGRVHEKKKFIEKQAKDLAEEYTRNHKAGWKKIEEWLVQSEMLPVDYRHDDKKSAALQIEGDVLFRMDRSGDGDESGLAGLLKHLFGG